MSIDFLAIGFFVYLTIGYQLGKLNIRVWREGRSKGFLPRLLFPMTASDGKVGADLGGDSPIAVANLGCHGHGDVLLSKKRVYLVSKALFWPTQIVWSFFSNGTLVWSALVDFVLKSPKKPSRRFDADGKRRFPAADPVDFRRFLDEHRQSCEQIVRFGVRHPAVNSKPDRRGFLN